MKKLMHVCAGLILCASITACETLKPAAETVADATYLYIEYENMVRKIAEMDFTPEERLVLEQVNDDINAIRLEIGQVYQGDGVEVLLGVLQARDYLSRLASTYVRGRNVLLDYYDSRNMAPNYELAVYDQAATMTYQKIKALVDESEQHVDLQKITLYLKAGLLFYASMSTGVPLGI